MKTHVVYLLAVILAVLPEITQSNFTTVVPTTTPLVSNSSSTEAHTTTPLVSNSSSTEAPTTTPLVSNSSSTVTPTTTPLVSNYSSTVSPTTTPMVTNSSSSAEPTTTPLVSKSSSTVSPTTTPLVTNSSSSVAPTTTPLETNSSSSVAPTTTPLETNSSSSVAPTTTPLVSNSSSSVAPTTTPLVTNSSSSVAPTTTPLVINSSSSVAPTTTPLETNYSSSVAPTTTPLVTNSSSSVAPTTTPLESNSSSSVAPTTTPLETNSSSSVSPTTTPLLTNSSSSVVPTVTPLITNYSPSVAPTTTPLETNSSSSVAPTITPLETNSSSSVAPTTTPLETNSSSSVAPTTTPLVTNSSSSVAPTTTPLETNSSSSVAPTTTPLLTNSSSSVVPTATPLITNYSPSVAPTTTPLATNSSSSVAPTTTPLSSNSPSTQQPTISPTTTPAGPVNFWIEGKLQLSVVTGTKTISVKACYKYDPNGIYCPICVRQVYVNAGGQSVCVAPHILTGSSKHYNKCVTTSVAIPTAIGTHNIMMFETLAYHCKANSYNNRGRKVGEVAVKAVQYVEFVIKYNKTFNVQMFDNSSSEFRQEELNIVSKLNNMLGNRIQDLRVIQFAPGSIMATAGMYVLITSPLAVSEVENVTKSMLWSYIPAMTLFIFRKPGACQPPVVKIINMDDSPFKAIEVKRSATHILQTAITLNCSSSNTVFEWLIRKAFQSGNTIHLSSVSQTVAKGTAEWTMNRRTLPYGLYLVEFRVKMTADPNMFSSDFKFLSIVESPILAGISGGSRVSRGFNQLISLDATLSEDPDVGLGNYTGMTFFWLCKKEGESFPNVPPTNLPVILANGPTGLGGCFDTGIGRLTSTERVVFINTGNMVMDTSYNIVLIVRKATRESKAEQMLKVVSGDPPQMTISCRINCGPRSSPSTRMKLTTNCTTPQHTCSKELTYAWSMHIWNGAWQEITNLQSELSTSISSPDVVIKADALLGGRKYRLTVQASAAGVTPGISSYEFTTNSPPTGGTCSVTPMTGEVLNTDFKLSCQGWTDPDRTLTYQIFYVTDPGLNSVVSYGARSEATTKLPVGKASEGYIIVIKFLIIDSLSAATKVEKNVKVIQPPSLDETNAKQILFSATSNVDSLLIAGDVRKATQLANAALATMANTPDRYLDSSEKTQVVDDIVKQMTSRVQVDNLQTLTQVTSVIGRATANPDEVSLKAQNESLNSMVKLTSLLQEKSKNTGAVDDGLLDAGAENLVLSLGNIMNSASRKAKVTGGTAPTSHRQRESIKASETSVKLVDKVGRTLLTRKVLGEQPSVVRTASLSMVLGRQRPEDIEKKKIEEAGASFTLPDDAILESLVEPLKIVDSQMVSTAFNPFTWDPTAQDINTFVTSFVLRDDRGNDISVTGLNKRIEITIPQRSSTTNDSTNLQSAFFKPAQMRYHKVHIRHQGVAIELKIESTQAIAIKLFIRFQEKPSISVSDYESFVADLPVCSSNTTQHVCSKGVSVVFISADLLQRQGFYYIGLLYDVTKTKGNVRTKRSCFGHGRQKRSCVEPKDPPRPQNRTIIPVYDPNTDVNYTMSTQQYGCLYWDSKKWSNTGCKVGSNSSARALQCLCNHLTSFGGNLFVAPNPIDFDVVLIELKRLDESGNVAVLSTIIVCLLIYVVVAVLARRADKNDQKRFGPVIAVSPDDSTGSQYVLTVITGVWRNCGTTANVVIVIHGTEAVSEPIVLSRNMRPSRVMLAGGNADSFIITLPSTLGPIEYLNVWHDNSGSDPSWFLKQIDVTNVTDDTSWHFVHNDWFALEKGEQKIKNILRPTSPMEMNTFKYAFSYRTTKKFTDDHLWLSVITKPPYSNFTRLQRATCCLCVLFSVMVVNAMFYKLDKTPDPTIQVGPLKFSWRQVIVGIQSSLIVVPVGLTIVALFRNSRARKLKSSRNSSVKKEVDLKTGCVCCRPGRSKETDCDEIIVTKRKTVKEALEKIKQSRTGVPLLASDNRSNSSYDVTSGTTAARTPRHQEKVRIEQDDITTSTLLNKLDNDECSEDYGAGAIAAVSSSTHSHSRNSNRDNCDEWKHEEDGPNGKPLNTSSIQSRRRSTHSQLPGYDVICNQYEETNYTKGEQREIVSTIVEETKTCCEKVFSLFAKANGEDQYFLPHCFIYVSWFLCFVVVAVSATFTFMYSLVWGKEIANQWLSSILVSFTQDLFAIQPIKICILAIFMSCFFREQTAKDLASKPKEMKRAEVGLENTTDVDTFEKVHISIPAETQLQKAKEYKIKENKMFAFAREMAIYVLFLVLLAIVCYGNRSYHGYSMTKNIKDDFNEFSKVSSDEMYWTWLSGQFASGIYAGIWYNNVTETKEEYIGNKMSILIGMPRMRQIRVQPDSCIVPEEAKSISTQCLDEYSFTEEDTTILNLPGWKPVPANMPWANLSKLCPRPWRYSTDVQLGFLPLWGYFHTYKGGGYVADLGYNYNTASQVISSLRRNKWIDRRTRVVLLEFSVFNPSTNYMSSSTFFYEVLPTSLRTGFQRIDSLALYGTQSGAYEFYLICILLFVILVIFYIFREARQIYRLKGIYFKHFWNWIEIVQVCSATAVVILHLVKEKKLLNTVTEIKKNPYVTVNFQSAFTIKEAENVAFSISIFVATLKILRMIRFNPHIIIFSSTLRNSRELLISYSVLIGIIILSFGLILHLVFGSDMFVFSTMFKTMYFELLMSIGAKMQLQELMNTNRVLGPLVGFTFKLLMIYIFLNFFVAILNDSYEDINSNTDRSGRQFEMSDFILERLMEILLRKRYTCGKEHEMDNANNTFECTSKGNVASGSINDPNDKDIDNVERCSDSGTDERNVSGNVISRNTSITPHPVSTKITVEGDPVKPFQNAYRMRRAFRNRSRTGNITRDSRLSTAKLDENNSSGLNEKHTLSTPEKGTKGYDGASSKEELENNGTLLPDQNVSQTKRSTKAALKKDSKCDLTSEKAREDNTHRITSRVFVLNETKTLQGNIPKNVTKQGRVSNLEKEFARQVLNENLLLSIVKQGENLARLLNSLEEDVHEERDDFLQLLNLLNMKPQVQDVPQKDTKNLFMSLKFLSRIKKKTQTKLISKVQPNVSNGDSQDEKTRQTTFQNQEDSATIRSAKLLSLLRQKALERRNSRSEPGTLEDVKESDKALVESLLKDPDIAYLSDEEIVDDIIKIQKRKKRIPDHLRMRNFLKSLESGSDSH